MHPTNDPASKIPNKPKGDLSDREILTTRVFDAPPRLVFEAWSRPDHLAQWWGPHGFTTTTHAFDFKPGGAWRLTMHGPDGVDYPNRIVFDEIVPSERIVFSNHGGMDGVPAEFKSTITFKALGAKTELTLRQVFRTAEDRDAVIERFGAAEGARQTLERLSGYVASLHLGKELLLTREFDAPRELVFEAWTTAEHLARWFAPHPLTVPQCKVDFRSGGVFRMIMRGPDGRDYPFEGSYVDIVVPERIVFKGLIHDEANQEVLTEVTFADHQGKTRITVRQTYAMESEATRGAKIGWSLTLNQLADFITAGAGPT